MWERLNSMYIEQIIKKLLINICIFPIPMYLSHEKKYYSIFLRSISHEYFDKIRAAEQQNC